MSFYTKRHLNHIIPLIVILCVGIFAASRHNQVPTYASGFNVVTVPSVINGVNIQGCPNTTPPPDDPAELITQWINNTANVPNGTPQDPTLVTFTPGCYDTEGTIYFDGGASTTFKDGFCVYKFQNPSLAACNQRRHDIIFDGSGAEFTFTTDGFNYGPSPGEDYFGQNGHGFSYEDMKWYVLGGSDLTFQNLNIQGPGKADGNYVQANDGAAGLEISGAQNVTIQNNTIDHIFGDFITMIGYHPLAGDMNEAPDKNINIQDNSFSYAGRNGISPDDVDGVTIQSNSISRTGFDIYDLETDTPAMQIDNVTINGDTDAGPYAVWLAITAGNAGPNGWDGTGSNILVENDNVSYAISVLANSSGNCTTKPVTGITIVNNTGNGKYTDGYDPLMLFRCATNIDVENNYNRVISYFHKNVFDVGQDVGVTIKNNTFPKANQDDTDPGQNPPLDLLGANNNPTSYTDCGNDLTGTPNTYFDGSCVVTPPPVCPTGDTGTPPNCVAPSSGSSKTSTTSPCPSGETGTPPDCKKPITTTTTTTASGSKAKPSTTTKLVLPTNSKAPVSLSLPTSLVASTGSNNSISEACYVINKTSLGCATKAPYSIKANTAKLPNGCNTEQITVYYTNDKSAVKNEQLCVYHKAKNVNYLSTEWIATFCLLAVFTASSSLVGVYHRKTHPFKKNHKDHDNPPNPDIIVG